MFYIKWLQRNPVGLWILLQRCLLQFFVHCNTNEVKALSKPVGAFYPFTCPAQKKNAGSGGGTATINMNNYTLTWASLATCNPKHRLMCFMSIILMIFRGTLFVSQLVCGYERERRLRRRLFPIHIFGVPLFLSRLGWKRYKSRYGRKVVFVLKILCRHKTVATSWYTSLWYITCMLYEIGRKFVYNNYIGCSISHKVGIFIHDHYIGKVQSVCFP